MSIDSTDAPDFERRFGALRRLVGGEAYSRLRSARIAVVGLGGVGSWAAEALARSGVGALTLIDLDHVAESNINRQVQALGSTLGMAKAQALRLRLQDIHPACRVTPIEEFASAENWPGVLDEPVDVVIDACDQLRAKVALATWSRSTGVPLVVSGAAGGKCVPQAVAVSDLADVTHDRLLAALRHQLRRADPAARSGPLRLTCVHSREPVHRPFAETGECASDGSLNCHGYGSSVTVTATFGMVAASEALRALAPAGAQFGVPTRYRSPLE